MGDQGNMGFAWRFVETVKSYATLFEIATAASNNGLPTKKVGRALEIADRLPLVGEWDGESPEPEPSPIEAECDRRGLDEVAYELVAWAYRGGDRPSWMPAEIV